MTVTVVDPITNEVQEYYIEKRLIRFLDKNVKPNLSKEDKDFVMLVDGYEGAGKSTFAIQVAKYVDPTFDLSRTCMTADEFKQAILHSKKNQAVIYDEAVTGMTAGDSITRVGRLLKSLMMQMRQKNLLVIVILPALFDLNRYAVLSRARCFFHIYESKGKRGYFIGYNKKATRELYLKGKKTYSYRVRSFFSGRFYGKLPIDKEGYLKKKEGALAMIDMDSKMDEQQRREDKLLSIFKEYTGLSYRNMSKMLKSKQYPFSTSFLQKKIADLMEKEEETTVEHRDIRGKTRKIVENVPNP